MDQIGLINKIYEAVVRIDFGRKGFAIEGKEREGRISYETGIANALTAFQFANSSCDPNNMLLAEYTFISQELQFCDKTDNHTHSSLTKAVQSFDDAFLALKAVEEQSYKISDNIFPHNGKFRVSGYPKDAFHIACISHKTRLQNILRSPGIDPIEKDLLKQRFTNLSTAQTGYLEKQKKMF